MKTRLIVMRPNLKNIILLICLLFSYALYSQRDNKQAEIKSSSVGMAGGSQIVSDNNTTYYISQSIGQSSVIGTKLNRDHWILQGYQQQNISVSMISSVANDLKASVFPNPFDDSINISFNAKMEEIIFIELIDMNGRLLLSEEHPAAQAVNIPVNAISSGIYNLKVSSNNKQFIAKIIKK